ncbi:MAG: hypothetical protein JNK21_11840 [Rhodospirillaceae bacterium]|nr:hypothetical protein [Rhodospirillaceae bacterium]
MQGSRRQVISWAVPLLVPGFGVTTQTPTSDLQTRIARLIESYSSQGDHLTGSEVDHASARWLADEIEALGVRVTLPAFTFSRVVVDQAELQWNGQRIQGLPLFDGGTTGPAGVTGRIGGINTDAEIGVVIASPFPTHPGLAPLRQARQAARHRAIIVVTDLSLPPGGIAPINADEFHKPFGPPVLQVPNQHWPVLQQAMATGARLTMTIATHRAETTAVNVQAEIPGRDSARPPMIVMTPRSGWGPCAAERGGGLAAFMEILRRFRAEAPLRRVIFTANSGHELGHLGLKRFLSEHGALVNGAHVWMHLGANFAAAKGREVWLQFSSEDWRRRVLAFTQRENLVADRDVPVGTPPLGEAKDIAAGKGAYVSILGANGLFHHPADRWPEAVDVATTARWVSAFAGLAQEAANQP